MRRVTTFCILVASILLLLHGARSEHAFCQNAREIPNLVEHDAYKTSKYDNPETQNFIPEKKGQNSERIDQDTSKDTTDIMNEQPQNKVRQTNNVTRHRKNQSSRFRATRLVYARINSRRNLKSLRQRTRAQNINREKRQYRLDSRQTLATATKLNTNRRNINAMRTRLRSDRVFGRTRSMRERNQNRQTLRKRQERKENSRTARSMAAISIGIRLDIRRLSQIRDSRRSVFHSQRENQRSLSRRSLRQRRYVRELSKMNDPSVARLRRSSMFRTREKRIDSRSSRETRFTKLYRRMREQQTPAVRVHNENISNSKKRMAVGKHNGNSRSRRRMGKRHRNTQLSNERHRRKQAIKLDGYQNRVDSATSIRNRNVQYNRNERVAYRQIRGLQREFRRSQTNRQRRVQNDDNLSIQKGNNNLERNGDGKRKRIVSFRVNTRNVGQNGLGKRNMRQRRYRDQQRHVQQSRYRIKQQNVRQYDHRLELRKTKQKRYRLEKLNMHHRRSRLEQRNMQQRRYRDEKFNNMQQRRYRLQQRNMRKRRNRDEKFNNMQQRRYRLEQRNMRQRRYRDETFNMQQRRYRLEQRNMRQRIYRDETFNMQQRRYRLEQRNMQQRRIRLEQWNTQQRRYRLEQQNVRQRKFRSEQRNMRQRRLSDNRIQTDASVLRIAMRQNSRYSKVFRENSVEKLAYVDLISSGKFCSRKASYSRSRRNAVNRLINSHALVPKFKETRDNQFVSSRKSHRSYIVSSRRSDRYNRHRNRNVVDESKPYNVYSFIPQIKSKTGRMSRDMKRDSNIRHSRLRRHRQKRQILQDIRFYSLKDTAKEKTKQHTTVHHKSDKTRSRTIRSTDYQIVVINQVRGVFYKPKGSHRSEGRTRQRRIRRRVSRKDQDSFSKKQLHFTPKQTRLNTERQYRSSRRQVALPFEKKLTIDVTIIQNNEKWSRKIMNMENSGYKNLDEIISRDFKQRQHRSFGGIFFRKQYGTNEFERSVNFADISSGVLFGIIGLLGTRMRKVV